MKKLLILLLLSTTITSCDWMENFENFGDKPTKSPVDYNARPADIPDTLVTGEKVIWDSYWRMQYNTGLVKVIYNEDGEPTELIMFADE